MPRRDERLPAPERVYEELELDRERAYVLYAVLKLQNEAAGATQDRLAHALGPLGLGKARVGNLLRQLEGGGYLTRCRIHGADARLIYEVEAVTTATYRDSAVVLLELLKRKGDGEGKVLLKDFVTHLLRSKKLRDYNHADLAGDGKQKGKIDTLVEASGHIERITPRWVKPRLKARVQVEYLELVKGQVPLEKLPPLRNSARR